MTATAIKPKTWKSRAVVRPIEPGLNAWCAHCDQRLKFIARRRATQVIANVYKRGVWQRVEHFHAECYPAAGQPYGEAQEAA